MAVIPKHLTWDELVPYERQQGGYWDYGTCTDVYGNGKTWVPVRNPAMAMDGEQDAVTAHAEEDR